MVYFKSFNSNGFGSSDVFFRLTVSFNEGVAYEFSKRSFIAYFHCFNFFFVCEG